MHSLRLGEFTVDPAAGGLVGPAGREQLDPKVMQVLVLLAQRAGDVVSRQDLLERVWPGVVVGEDAVSRCIYQLRRHLQRAGGDERHAALVETLPKRGYRLNCESSSVRPIEPAATTGGVASTSIPAAVQAPRTAWRTGGRLLAAAVFLAVAAFASWLLWRTDRFWEDPLAHARFARVTDFDGVAPGVAISRDGRSVAFLAQREGRLDAWIGELGSGRFRNLTRGRVPGIDNPVRSLGFTPDGAQVTVWSRRMDAEGGESVHTWVVPTSGGPPRPYLDHVAEVGWSPNGARMVYHPAAPGDPLFVAAANGTDARQIYIAPNGVHCHFPLWSPDGRFIYFVQGRPPDAMDVWRIPSEGGEPERITFHESRVSHPVFIDATTLLYLATSEDGTGPWLHGIDTRRRVAHRLGQGLEQYTALAASADGRRLVATRTTPRTSLWRVPMLERVAREADARRISLPAAGGRAPRLGPGYLVFVSPSDGSGLRRLRIADQAVTELWNGGRKKVLAGPAIDPVGQRIAFSFADGGTTRLQVMEADGSGARILAANLKVTGAPVWSPDGSAIVIAAGQDRDTRLFRVPLDGAPPVPLAADYSRDAAWSPDGSFLVYNGADVGPTFAVGAISTEGRPQPLPQILLPRGARRLAFVPGGRALVVLKGDARKRDFWLVDLGTGRERQLTDFDSGFAIGDFDLSADGREIVFDQLREETDVVQIDLARR